MGQSNIPHGENVQITGRRIPHGENVQITGKNTEELVVVNTRSPRLTILDMLLLNFLLAFGLVWDVKGAKPTDHQGSTGEVQVDVLGQSGAIKITPLATADSGRWVKLSWSKIEEKDDTGKVVAFVNNMASQTFEWGAPSTDDEGTTIAFSATLNNGAHLRVEVFFTNLSKEVNVTNEDGTEWDIKTIPANGVEFTITLSGWPFKDQANTLTMGTELQTQSGKSKMDITDFLAGEEKATVTNNTSGEEKEVNVKNTTVDDGGNKASISWVFPAFHSDETLYYDPTLKTSHSGVSMLQPGLASLAAVLFASWLSLLSYDES
eukprot:g2500.t1